MPSWWMSISRNTLSRGVIQFLVLLIGVLFESIRNKHYEIAPFLLINLFDVHRDAYWMGTEALRGFIYNFAAHIQWIAVCLMMWQGSVEDDVKTDRLFFILALLDFIDYLLWGNNLWFSFTLIPHGTGFGLIMPMSMNVVSLIVFGRHIFRRWRMNG